MELADTHAHLEDLGNLDEALMRAEKAGVFAVITMGSDRKSNLWALEESSKHQRGKLRIYPAIGLHPWGLEPSKIEDNIQLIEENVDKAVALGEIGLDYWYKDVRKSPEKKEQQRELFRRLLEIAKENGKPVSIHSRGAWADCANTAIETGIRKAVFHWFSGPLDVLEKLLREGYYISATPAASYSKEHRNAIHNTPLQSLLLETDSPVIYREEKSEPAHVLKTLSAVAELKGLREEALAEQTTDSARRLFGI
ncbi:MAG: TatD family hydrolase [Candidatus Bathyarchaeota archaeon]|nr:TatD family hydrolase [Candidatus Bathyarchaeota archaeon]